METFHIQFQWPLSTVKTMMDKINVGGLGDINPTTSMYSSWANKADWQEFTSSIASQMITKSSDEAIQAVDNLLTSAELKLNELLVSSESSEVKLAGVKSLIADIEEIQGLICSTESIEHYPFFARWFTLSIMVLTVYNQYESRVAQVRIVQLWYIAKDYVQSAMHIATAERKNQIALAVADDDLFYIKDYGNQTALSVGVNFQSEDMKDLTLVQDIIATEKAQQYLNDLKFSEIVSLLSIGRNAIAVTGESRTSQENVANPTLFWDDYTETINTQLAQDREKLTTSYAQLAYSEAQPLPSYTVEPLELRAADKDKPEKVDAAKLTESILNEVASYIDGSNKPTAVQIAKSIFSLAVGAIPGVGGVLSGITNLVFAFLGSNKEEKDPWLEFEKQLLYKVGNLLGEAEVRDIQNKLKTIDEYLKIYTNTMAKALERKLTDNDLITLRSDISIQVRDIKSLKNQFLNPTSASHVHTAPCFLHFFQTSILVLSAAKTLDIDIAPHKQTLYDDTLKYITLAISGIVNQRKGEVYSDYTSNCSGSTYFIKDRRLDKKLSGDFSGKSYGYECLVNGTKNAAGLVAAIQILKETTGVVIENIKVDNPAIADSIKRAYQVNSGTSIWHWQGQAWSYTAQRDAKALLPKIPDTGVISFMDYPTLYSLNETVKLPKTVFELKSL